MANKFGASECGRTRMRAHRNALQHSVRSTALTIRGLATLADRFHAGGGGLASVSGLTDLSLRKAF